ncbi:MAG: hypothetical protein LKJ18_01815 [Ancrocorticia sp.]|nr:hypothetical protein [Ancrocorticia sp.]MCI1962875.1 hypothetical protein [Ancrocorticia sp.]MCI2001845.1 hypothetical protein [Ancrocorticia sp.]MCI2001898.1 hypothetical protein [Ancrocorticia sp.]
MSTTATTQITWIKLRNGSWGIKGFDLTEGEQVTVTKKSGETKTVTVGKVIWTGTDGLSIATVATATHSRSTYTSPTYTRRYATGRLGQLGTSSHRCEECGRSGAHAARDMSGISGWLCNSCDDGSASFC